MKRVLVANRGAIARRILRFYRETDEDVETVSVFHEPDVEQPWVDEADYAVYLNGDEMDETYLNPQRVISSAMDAGCDAIHTGFGLLTEHAVFHDLAGRTNLEVIGVDPKLLRVVQDRDEVHRLARKMRIAVIPATGDLPDDGNVGELAARVGYPLFVKASAGGSVRRVSEPKIRSGSAAPSSVDRGIWKPSSSNICWTSLTASPSSPILRGGSLSNAR